MVGFKIRATGILETAARPMWRVVGVIVYCVKIWRMWLNYDEVSRYNAAKALLCSSDDEKKLNAPKDVLDKAPIMVWYYISSDFTPIKLTTGPLEIPSFAYANCPPLDLLFIPGPDPAAPLLNGCAEFLRERIPKLKALLTVCTGSMAIAQAGVLDGLCVCSNKLALKMSFEADTLNKNVTWGWRQKVDCGR